MKNMIEGVFRKTITQIKVIRLLFVFISIGAASNPAIGQFDKEALKSEIQKLDASIEKLDLLDTLLAHLPSLLEPSTGTEVDSAIKYKVIFTDLALELGFYDKAAKEAVRAAAYYDYYINTTDSFPQNLLEKFIPYIDNLKSTKTQGDIYTRLGLLAYGHYNYQEAIVKFDEAINRYGKNDSSFIAKTYYFKGVMSRVTGDFMKALADYNKAFEMYETLKDTTIIYYVMSDLARLYSMNDINDKAISIYKDLASITLSQNKYSYLSVVTINHALILKRQKKYKEQEEKLNLAYEYVLKVIPKSENSKVNEVLIKSEMGDLYLSSNRFKLAEEILDSLDKKLYFYQNNDAANVYYLYYKSSVLMAQGKTKEALALQSNLVEKAKSFGDIEVIIGAYLKSSKIYESLNDAPNALKYHQKYVHLKDSVFNVVRHNQLIYYQTEFETSQKEKLLIQQDGDIKLLESEKKYNKNLLLFSILGLSSVFLIAYLIRSKKFTKKQKEIQENFSTELIEQQEMERKRVSENLHDSLGQSLLLIKNKVYLNDDLDTQQIVDNAIDEVHKISVALHPLQLEQLGLTEALKSTIKSLDDSSDVFFSSSIDNITGMFEAKKELNIYRMFQELLSNVVKHSQAKACKVSAIVKSGYLLVDIEDNGLGFDFTEEYNKINSLGLKTLKGRMKKLNGSIVFNTEKNKGTTVSLKIPI